MVGHGIFYQMAVCEVLFDEKIYTVTVIKDSKSIFNVVLKEGIDNQLFFYIGKVDLNHHHTFLISISKNLELFVLCQS